MGFWIQETGLMQLRQHFPVVIFYYMTPIEWLRKRYEFGLYLPKYYPKKKNKNVILNMPFTK